MGKMIQLVLKKSIVNKFVDAALGKLKRPLKMAMKVKTSLIAIRTFKL